jgi:large subunit ribosomal protein L10
MIAHVLVSLMRGHFSLVHFISGGEFQMPNAKVLESKQAIVAELTEKLQTAASGVLIDYKGITVAEDTALRNELRANGVDYSVVKNTLTRFAAQNAGLSDLTDCLNGTTSLALSTADAIAPMRVINKFSKQFNGAKFTIKAGFMDGKILPLNEILAIAELPSKEVLQAQVLGTMLAPITSLAIVLKAIADEKGGFVEAAAESVAE